ncbi:Condensin-2 complex subunit H2 [Myotis brandtii]|uniref:Condensin-2 complex subunit H2 n=1 Tax=Myotis brandtii TaxID=109478 RepID=S7PEX2_MYOBR|nr:Condensin-2 complex subunit H2 [Myotis brandtii]
MSALGIVGGLLSASSPPASGLQVEYLYSLVYQALDFISGKRRARQLAAQEDGASRDASSRASQRVEDEFLSLDDLPDTRANVDLRNEQAPCEVAIVPLLPMALVALDEMDKNSHPLYRFGPRPGPAGCAEEQPMEVSMIRSPVPVPGISQESGTSPEGPMPAGGDEDEDAEGVAELPEVPLEPQESRSPQQSKGGDIPEAISLQSTAQPRRFELRERREALEPVSQLKETPDPWQSLDPFSSLDSKPFKKGKPYSVPACVEEVPGQKRKRKGAAKLQDFHQWYLATYMEVLYWKHVREQLETLRKLQRREASTGHWPHRPGWWETAVAHRFSAQAAKRWLPRAEEELWPVEEDRLEDSLEELGAAADDFLEPEEYAEPDGAKPEDAADLEAEAMPASLSYEELVRRNVELFITTSQKFVQETELSQRVRDWEDSIQPLLQEQEQHVPFDIHLYGDQMVSKFSQLNQWCPFAKLVSGQPAFEVCRAMLASLQLANDHTVEITQQPGLEAAVDTMSLRLLTHQRAHKHFQTYTAPSMAQP